MEEQLINTLFSLVRDMEFLIQLTAMPFLVSFHRCLECRLCTCGAASGTADFPRRLGRRSAGGDHQGAGNADPRTDSRDEPELHRIQVPADQEPSLAKGNKFKCGSSDWRTTGGRRHAFRASVAPSAWEGGYLVVDHFTSSSSSPTFLYSFVLMMTWYYSCYLSECLSQT